MRDRLLWGLAIGGEIIDQIVGGGCRAYHGGKLFIWTPPGYAKKKYRDLIQRMHREGYVQRVLVDGQPHFRITGAGRRQLTKMYPVLKLSSEKWDGFWRIVIFDVPERKRRSRDVLRRQLRKLGFGRLQHSTYISPYDFGKPFLDFLQARGLIGQVLLLESKQKYLGKPRDLAAKVWELDRLAEDYRQIIERLSTRFGIKNREKREGFLKKVYQQYLMVLMRDPFLPQELLPKDWPAEKAHKYILRAGVVKE
jgi:phenylacetic acid degradation operon negative regulatory protein